MSYVFGIDSLSPDDFTISIEKPNNSGYRYITFTAEPDSLVITGSYDLLLRTPHIQIDDFLKQSGLTKNPVSSGG